MILPTKRLPEDRALLAVGGDVLSLLSEPATVSKVWSDIKEMRSSRTNASPLSFDWFVLAVALLFSMKLVELNDGRLKRVGM
ncbi:hypothetical protein SAMN05421819_1884 [Bryocella elongata]|uniref:Uncharacterized protein n=1 Tax=Bryocella elongata TaxID=863522 RepID=A0A1H5XMB6_9BACT|nr:hypothetical protein SAMN05421819_1884 [Bryocella elongata]